MLRSIDSVGTRFLLLSSALKMIQGEIVNRDRFSRIMLRYRIYMSAFDYFSLPPQTPIVDLGTKLNNDIKQLVKFWQAVYKDAKYIKGESFSSISMVLISLSFHYA